MQRIVSLLIMSLSAPPKDPRLHVLTYTDDEAAICPDEELEEIRIAMRDAFNPKPDLSAHQTASLAPDEKWRWAYKGVVKKTRTMRMIQGMGFQTDTSQLAAAVIATAKEDISIQQKLSELRESNWGFDVFSIDHEYPLTIIGHEIIIQQKQYHRVHGFFEQKMITFLYRIESEYKKHLNSYHSNYHAADVLVTMNWCLDHSALIDHNLSNFERFALLIAAIIHDVGHDGRNNQFHIDTKSDLAITYHDLSPLENYHISTAFRCLYRGDSNWMSSLSMALQNEFKKIVMECVLSTDMHHHTANMAKIGNLLADLQLSGQYDCKTTENTTTTLRVNDDQRELVMHSLLHLTDISNPMKPFRVALRWGLNVYAEFFDQGDEELKIGLRPSPLCDREKADILKGQIGFSKFVVRPLLDLMLPLFPEFEVMEQCIERNTQIYSAVVALPDRPPNDLKSLNEFFASFNDTTVGDAPNAPMETAN